MAQAAGLGAWRWSTVLVRGAATAIRGGSSVPSIMPMMILSIARLNPADSPSYSRHCPSSPLQGATMVASSALRPHPVIASALGRWLRLGLLGALATLLSGCGYNEFQSKDESVKAAWSEVVNQYQRRADLIPNLVNTVKGFAAQEKEVLVGVTEARAKATSMQVTPEVLNNPEAFARFQQAQSQLSGALSRLMAVAEAYPQLKSDANFRDLQVQLEGTENRITVARQRYIATVRDYNVLARSFPTNLTAMVFGYETKANFSVENEKAIATPPAVKF